MDWSHDLLADDERALLRRLGAFVGGFSLDAAEYVGAGEGVDAYAVLDLLSSLVDNSLVQAEEHGPLVRYGLLQTVRQYALDRLTDAGERGPTLARHRDWFLALAEQAAPALETSRQQEWLEVLDRDAANFVAALERSTPTEGEQALRLALRWGPGGLRAAAMPRPTPATRRRSPLGPTLPRVCAPERSGAGRPAQPRTVSRTPPEITVRRRCRSRMPRATRAPRRVR